MPTILICLWSARTLQRRMRVKDALNDISTVCLFLNSGVLQWEIYHNAKKHCPTMFHTATVRPKRSGPIILYNTPLTTYDNWYEVYALNKIYVFMYYALPFYMSQPKISWACSAIIN